MLMHVDHLVPGMELESDVKLKAGSFLTTRKELQEGKLDESVIESMRRFASQLAPHPYKIRIREDENTLRRLVEILTADIQKIADNISKGREIPNFLQEQDLREKVMRVMDKLISNPEIVKNVYDFKIRAEDKPGDPVQLILEHSIRTTLLVISLGLKMRWSIISLVNVGMAAMLHDMGIILTNLFPKLERIDEMSEREHELFIEEHQGKSALIFREQKLTLLPFTRKEIETAIAYHHRPDFSNTHDRSTLLLYFAVIVDEMVSEQPHKLRYNFYEGQLEIVGRKLSHRTGMVTVLLALIRLYKEREVSWEIVQTLCTIFNMSELLVEGYEEKLEKIIQFCPYDSAVAYPMSGAAMPRTIYCSSCDLPDFQCEHMSQSTIEIRGKGSKSKSFNKCATLSGRLFDLNCSGPEDPDGVKARRKLIDQENRNDEQ